MLGYQEHFSFSFCAVSLVTCENAVMKISLWEAQLRLYKHTHQCLTWCKYYWMRQQWSGFKQKAQFPLVMRTHTHSLNYFSVCEVLLLAFTGGEVDSYANTPHKLKC